MTKVPSSAHRSRSARSAAPDSSEGIVAYDPPTRLDAVLWCVAAAWFILYVCLPSSFGGSWIEIPLLAAVVVLAIASAWKRRGWHNRV